MHDQKRPHIEKVRFLECQLESLWRLTRAYDIVILDDSESILAQFSSETVMRFQAVMSSFKRIIQTSQKTLCMDAFLNDRTIQTCLELVQEPDKLRFTENTSPANMQQFSIFVKRNQCQSHHQGCTE